MVRDRDVHAFGVRSPLLEVGDMHQPEAAVFVHGNPGSGEDWRALLRDMEDVGRAVAPDMPGFGRADKPPSFDYTVQGYARHLGGMLQALGIRRAHLVLHDFGGPWGLVWAATHPDQCASLTLINSGVLTGYRWHAVARLWRTPLIGELVMMATTHSRFRRSIERGNPRGLPPSFVDRMYRDFDRDTRRAVLRLYRATDDPGGQSSRMLAAALRSLDPPALVIWGRHDPYIPLDFAERQRDVFPRARVVVLDQSGHWPFVDDATAVRDALVPFLRQQMQRP